MDKVANMNVAHNQAKTNRAKNKSIGKALNEALKGETESVPSKVSKAEVHRSSIKLSGDTRNMKKCGYNSKE